MNEERGTMNDGPHRVVHPSGEPPTIEAPAERKRPTKTRRLIGIALLALLSVFAFIVLTPRPLKKFLPRLPGARSARVASSPADPGPLPAVQDAWDKLDLGAMPADVAPDLESGKYYYDKRFPGNFGLAIGYWKQALGRLAGTDRDGVQRLVASAERELARQFSSDSGDAVVLLKQGKRDQALILLERMRADFLDITAPQYKWASVMLSRQRR
jgi:hypothetical protein